MAISSSIAPGRVWSSRLKFSPRSCIRKSFNSATTAPDGKNCRILPLDEHEGGRLVLQPRLGGAVSTGNGYENEFSCPRPVVAGPRFTPGRRFPVIGVT